MKTRTYVVAGVGGERFALGAERVETVLEYRRPVPIPGRPEPFLGALTHQGELVPIASLGALVGLEPRVEPGRAAIVVLGWEEGFVGLAVERTHGLLTEEGASREARVLGRRDGPYFSKTLEAEGERIHVLDLDALLSDLEERVA